MLSQYFLSSSCSPRPYSKQWRWIFIPRLWSARIL